MKTGNVLISLVSILIILTLLASFGCTGTGTTNSRTNPNQNQSKTENTATSIRTHIDEQQTPIPTRESLIPATAVKMTPETDPHPLKLTDAFSNEWEQPVPVAGQVNTAGAEDSPFITPDGNTLYFFFTPDVRVPVEKQILDGVTGIWVSKKQGANGEWGKPERVILQDPGKLSLDGCEFVQGNVMWFCSVREGYTGIHWFTAELVDGKWTNWKNADFDPSYQVGELHMITANNDEGAEAGVEDTANELYFHSDRPGGNGDLDIWASKKGPDGRWQEPQNLETVNSERSEGWPYVTPDGKELWISKDYGIWRSKKINGTWTTPELVISPLAGEASLDNEGNIYFVHHYYKNDTMIEADIYMAKRKAA